MAVPPQVIALAAQLVQERRQQALQKNQENLQEIPDLLSGFGSLLEQGAIRSDGQSNVGQSTFAGALRGAGAGASLGPLGIIGGALFGATSGFGSANQSNANFFDDKALNEAFQLSAKTVSPSTFGDGGYLLGEELEPVQMELDESYVDPNLGIYDSKAKKLHKDMDDDEVTDVVAPGSFVFSNNKSFTAKNHADKVLGYGYAKYDEEGGYELEKVTLGRVFGDSGKDVPFSKAVKMLKSKYNTVRDGKNPKEVDLLTQVTNQENRQARAPYLNELIRLHEGQPDNSDPLIPQKFSQGGKVKKYDGGGMIIAQLLGQLDNEEGANANLLQSNLKRNRNLFGRMNTRAGLSALIQGLSVGLQDTRVDPRFQDTRFADEIFEEVSPAVVDQLTGQGRASANSTIANIARVSPQAATRVAPQLFDSALRQSNSTALNLLRDNLSQRRSRFGFLNRTNNANRIASIEASEASRNLINRKRTALANIGTSLLSNRDTLDVSSINADSLAQRQFDTTNNTIGQNRLNLQSLQARLQAQEQANQELLNRLYGSSEEVNLQGLGLGTTDISTVQNLG